MTDNTQQEIEQFANGGRAIFTTVVPFVVHCLLYVPPSGVWPGGEFRGEGSNKSQALNDAQTNYLKSLHTIKAGPTFTEHDFVIVYDDDCFDAIQSELGVMTFDTTVEDIYRTCVFVDVNEQLFMLGEAIAYDPAAESAKRLHALLTHLHHKGVRFALFVMPD